MHPLALTRRGFLTTAAISTAAAKLRARDTGGPDLCPRCGGVGLIPLTGAKPFVWVSGGPAAKAESAVGEQHCPQCKSGSNPKDLVDVAQERIDRAQEKHAQWKERIGGRLLLVLTRHAALHTQFTPVQAKSVGQAIETLTLHLKQISSSLVLTPTRLSDYEQILLWERPAWDQFRKVMEGLYTPEQLGESWPVSRDFSSYDHFVTPHLYETPQTIRQRPPTHGSVFLAARRQVNIATNWKAPVWLAEGFAAYGDHSVHKANRWFTIYDPSQKPTAGEWFAESRRLATAGELRPWSKMLGRELREWQPADYVQTLAMTAFLVESEPAKFLDFNERLAAGDDPQTALEQAYRRPLAELEQRCTKWLIARR